MSNGPHSASRDSGNSRPFINADSCDGRAQIAITLTVVLADVFTLYFKAKNFRWHVSGPHFRDYHLLFDQQAEDLLVMTDLLAERVRKVGGNTLRSVQHILRLARLSGNDADFLAPPQMLAELRGDNEQLAGFMRDAHFMCGGFDDLASMRLLETWIDEAEGRVWFLAECGRNP
jgi:starvation-inducible DNA-binding protein